MMEKFLSSHDSSRLGSWMAVDLVLLRRPVDTRPVDWPPSFYHGPSEETLPFEGAPRGEGAREGVGQLSGPAHS